MQCLFSFLSNDTPRPSRRLPAAIPQDEEDIQFLSNIPNLTLRNALERVSKGEDRNVSTYLMNWFVYRSSTGVVFLMKPALR